VTWQSLFDFIESNGFNAIRVPFSAGKTNKHTNRNKGKTKRNE